MEFEQEDDILKCQLCKNQTKSMTIIAVKHPKLVAKSWKQQFTKG